MIDYMCIFYHPFHCLLDGKLHPHTQRLAMASVGIFLFV